MSYWALFWLCSSNVCSVFFVLSRVRPGYIFLTSVCVYVFRHCFCMSYDILSSDVLLLGVFFCFFLSFENFSFFVIRIGVGVLFSCSVFLVGSNIVGSLFFLTSLIKMAFL